NRRAGALLGSGEEAPDHDSRGASGESLRNIPRIPHPAVGDYGDIVLCGLVGTIDYRRELGDADSGDNAGDTDAPRANADLHRVGARLDQVARSARSRHVPGDDLDLP